MVLILVIGSVGVAGEAQTSSETDPFAPLRVLAGSWEGSIDGRLGTGVGVREYEFILDDKYLLLRHASVRQPQEKSVEGDHHRELSIFSFDSERKKLVLRQFVVEGFVNRYTCDTSTSKIVCVTEHVESGPGVSARYTIEIQNPYSFNEIFELAWPGEELSVYFTNRWTRRPSLPR
jgi:hypothetical protein